MRDPWDKIFKSLGLMNNETYRLYYNYKLRNNKNYRRDTICEYFCKNLKNIIANFSSFFFFFVISHVSFLFSEHIRKSKEKSIYCITKRRKRNSFVGLKSEEKLFSNSIWVRIKGFYHETKLVMIHQKKRIFGIIFSIVLISLVFLMKNIVWAAVDSNPGTHIITGTNISGGNISNYNVSLQFSGFLDVGDIVTVQLIDSSLATSTPQIYTGLWSSETGKTFVFNATSLTGWVFTMSGNISGLAIVGPITATGMLDVEIPTFTGVTSWDIYTTWVTIEFFDNNAWVTAILSGINVSYYSGTFQSWSIVATSGTYILIITDIVGNSTWAVFTINIPDTTPPAITNITSGQYFSGDVTPTIVETNYSWTVVNFSWADTIYTWITFTLTGEWYYFITVYDLTGNNTSLGFTIDKTPPTFTGVTSGTVYYTWVTIWFSDNNTWVTATLSGVNYTWALITATGTYEFIVTDLAGNFTWAIFTIATDVTWPTWYVIYTTTGPTNTDVFASITWFSEEITGLNATGHNFTGNGTFIFTFQDLVGNTGETTATVTWIDKSPVTGTINYSITGNTNQDVLATITFNKTWVTWVTWYTFTGNWTYNFTFTDAYGNTWSETATVTWIDKTPVTGTVVYNITWNTNQDVVAEITWFNKTWVIITSSWTHLFTGNWTYNFTFTDAYGNTGLEVATVTWIDKSPVTGTINYSITWNTNQDVVAEITFNKTWVTWVTWHVFTWNDTYNFTFTDAYGNTWSETATVTWIDKTAPTASASYSPASLTSGDVTVILTWYSETLTGINPTNIVFTWNGTGAFTFYDLAGNTWTTIATVTWIDKTAPTATVSYSITGNTNQDVVATISWNETIVGITGHTFTGNDTYIFNFTDLAGNPGIATGTVSWIDKTAPTASTSYSITWLTNQDVVATITWFNKTWVTITSSWTHTFTGNWSYIFTFADTYWNTGSETATVTWIDKSPVTGTVIYSTTWRTSGNVTAEITWFNKTWVIITSSWTHLFTGNWSYLFTFTDAYGNTWSNTATVTWIDKTLPVVWTWFISLGNTWVNGSTWYYNGTITIKATMSDAWAGISGASCEYSTGVSRAAATYTWWGWYCSVSVTPNANSSIRFRIQDTVGNLNTWWITSYIYDNTAPTVADNASPLTGRVDVTVTLVPTDTWIWVSWTFYCVDTWGTCTPTTAWVSVSVTWTTGVVTHKFVRYYSIDRLGNSWSIQTSTWINIDKETPVLTGTTTFSSNNDTNTWYARIGGTITVIFQSHEILTGTPTMTISWWSLTTGIVTNIWGNNYSGTFVMKSADVEGLIGFNIFMTDLVGNTWTIPITSALIFDKTAPAGIVFTNPISTSYRQNQTWSAYRDITRSTWSEINFGSTSLQIEYSINMFWWVDTIITTGTNNDWSYHRTVNSVDTSSAQMRILATDLAWNTTTFTSSGFKIDSTPPTGPTFIYPTWSEFLKWGSWYTIRRTGWVDANLSWKILQRSTDGWLNFTTLTTLADGDFFYVRTPSNSLNSSTIRLGIYYIDRWWLTSPYVQTTNFIIDSTKPTLAIVDTNTARRNTNATWTATWSDSLAGLRATGIVYRTDTQFDQYCTSGSQTPWVISAEWTGYVYACVQDNAGNTTTGVQMYRIDKTPPTLDTGAIVYANAGKVTNITTNDTWGGISGYVRSKVTWAWTISFVNTGSKNPTVTASTEWTYTLQVIVTDVAGNSTSWIITFIRDTTLPILSWAATVSVSNSTATFTFTGNETWSVGYSWTCWTGSLISSISWNNTTTFTLANATYSSCQLRVTDNAGNASLRLLIPTFTVNYTAPSGGWGGWWGGWWIPICLDTQLMCTNGKYVKKSGISCQLGNLDKVCWSDICVDGDYSGNPSDGLCKDPTKVEASTGVTSTGRNVLFSSPFNKELTDAYFYAYNIKITTISDIKRANLTWILIRSHLAKMMSEYAIKVLGLTPNTARKCVFSDMQNQPAELKQYAIIACQLGLMGLKTDGTPASKFTPDGQVDRAIFGATLSRALRGETYNGGQNWYAKHLDALYANKIISNKDKPFNRELRGYVLLMMMRADRNIIKSTYLNFTSLRWTTSFVPNTAPTSTSQFSTTEIDFIKNIKKDYQFTEGYTVGQSNAGVKYLQYFLKAKKYYTGSINGTNTQATVDGLFQFQLDNEIVADIHDTWAGYLGPTTRETINPLLRKLLNP